jgi:hypothetical protein
MCADIIKLPIAEVALKAIKRLKQIISPRKKDPAERDLFPKQGEITPSSYH